MLDCRFADLLDWWLLSFANLKMKNQKLTIEENEDYEKNLPIDQILCGNNLELIHKLPDRSVQLVITSPPYFQQRDYGAGHLLQTI